MDFVQVEGINLYQHIYETDQLSVVRGTSFIYKDAINYLSVRFADDLVPISTGASSGLYVITSSRSAELLCNFLQQALRDHPHFSLVPFLVVTAKSATLSDATQHLLTQIRFKQLTTVTVLPDRGIFANGVCELSGLRIQNPECERQIQSGINASTRRLSRSVEQRYVYGREKRQSFYQELVSEETARQLESYEFAQHLEDIAADPSIELLLDQPVFPKLGGKLAVFYADGNQFSTVQTQYIERLVSQQNVSEIDAQKRFDKAIQQCRNDFLNDTIQWLITEERRNGFAPLASSSDGGRKVLRLETLLWGGDEMTFVLPAWCGFEFVQRFFDWDWQFEGLDQPLTHAAGVVFCHAKSPIRIIQAFSCQLADNIKQSEGGRDGNGWDYLVLESIDYPTNPKLAHYFETRYGASVSALRSPALRPVSDWQSQKVSVTQWLDEGLISARQLHLLARSAQHQSALNEIPGWQQYFGDGPVDATHPVAAAEFRLCEIHDNKVWLQHQLPIIAETLFGLCFDTPQERLWFWLHVSELCDYFAPFPTLAASDLRSTQAVPVLQA